MVITGRQGNIQHEFKKWEPECESLTIYATWGNNTVVDLLVTEPSGKTVSTAQITGDNGAYIHNFNENWGPKVYQTNCPQIENGEYKI